MSSFHGTIWTTHRRRGIGEEEQQVEAVETAVGADAAGGRPEGSGGRRFRRRRRRRRRIGVEDVAALRVGTGGRTAAGRVVAAQVAVRFVHVRLVVDVLVCN